MEKTRLVAFALATSCMIACGGGDPSGLQQPKLEDKVVGAPPKELTLFDASSATLDEASTAQRFTFTGRKGWVVEVSVNTYGPPGASSGFRPHVTMALDGNAIVQGDGDPDGTYVELVTLTDDGSYEIDVSGADAKTGNYQVKAAPSIACADNSACADQIPGVSLHCLVNGENGQPNARPTCSP